MQSEKKLIDIKFKELIKSNKVPFPPKKEHWEREVPIKKGVYVIYDSKEKVAHVGSTPRAKNGLRQRLGNHLNAQSSFVAKALKHNGNLLRNGYKVRWVIVSNDRLRALLECYTIGNLRPSHIGIGNSTGA